MTLVNKVILTNVLLNFRMRSVAVEKPEELLLLSEMVLRSQNGLKATMSQNKKVLMSNKS